MIALCPTIREEANLTKWNLNNETFCRYLEGKKHTIMMMKIMIIMVNRNRNRFFLFLQILFTDGI